MEGLNYEHSQSASRGSSKSGGPARKDINLQVIERAYRSKYLWLKRNWNSTDNIRDIFPKAEIKIESWMPDKLPIGNDNETDALEHSENNANIIEGMIIFKFPY